MRFWCKGCWSKQPPWRAAARSEFRFLVDGVGSSGACIYADDSLVPSCLCPRNCRLIVGVVSFGGVASPTLHVEGIPSPALPPPQTCRRLPNASTLASCRCAGRRPRQRQVHPRGGGGAAAGGHPGPRLCGGAAHGRLPLLSAPAGRDARPGRGARPARGALDL